MNKHYFSHHRRVCNALRRLPITILSASLVSLLPLNAMSVHAADRVITVATGFTTNNIGAWTFDAGRDHSGSAIQAHSPLNQTALLDEGCTDGWAPIGGTGVKCPLNQTALLDEGCPDGWAPIGGTGVKCPLNQTALLDEVSGTGWAPIGTTTSGGKRNDGPMLLSSGGTVGNRSITR